MFHNFNFYFTGANFYSIRHAYRKQLLRWHPKLHDHSSESIHVSFFLTFCFSVLWIFFVAVTYIMNPFDLITKVRS